MKKSTVHLFIFDTMADWEYGYAVAGINNPQFQKTPGAFKVKTVAMSGQPVTSIGGLRVAPEMVLEKLKPANSALLILPGGMAWDKKKNQEAAQLAAEFLAHCVPVAAICGATAGLARAGLLDKVPHTSNAQDYLAQTGYRGTAFYRDEPSVKSGHLITASSTGPLEFARDVFSALGIYSNEVLAAWYRLFKTGEAKYYADVMKAAQV